MFSQTPATAASIEGTHLAHGSRTEREANVVSFSYGSQCKEVHVYHELGLSQI